MAVRARASLEEWTATTESRDGPRTQVPHRDRRLVVRLDSTAEDEDPLATWRAARDAEAAEAHARSLKMPWGKLHGKTGLREEGMSGQGAFLSSGFDTVDHEGSHHSPEDQTTRFDDTALSMLEHDMMLRRSRSSRGRSQVVPSREYWRPWLPQPEATVTVAPSREELGRREHDGPRPEQRSPGAKEVLWDYRTMQAHKQLWGGGGNWQPSVDAWEAKEAAKRAADARIAQEAIVSRGLHTDKTPYHKLNMDDALSGGPSFVSVDSRASDFMSEGDLSLPNASAQLSSYTESAGAAGITWTKIEKKHKWDVQSWTQGLLRRAERIASDSEPTRSVAVVRMKPLTELQQEVPTATTSTYGSDEDEKQLRLDSRGVDHLNQADSLSNVKSTSLRVDTQAASTGGATSKNMLIGSESVSASRGTRSPTRQAEAPGRSGPAAVSPLWGSETGKSRRAGARKPAAVYRPPAWELTSSHLRKFQETSLPIVRFDKDPPCAPLERKASKGRQFEGFKATGPAETEPVEGQRPVFPWIESTIPRAESDAWARTSYDGIATTIDPSGTVSHEHPLPWRPISPQRAHPVILADVPVHESDKALSLRTRTMMTLDSLRIQEELQKLDESVSGSTMSPITARVKSQRSQRRSRGYDQGPSSPDRSASSPMLPSETAPHPALHGSGALPSFRKSSNRVMPSDASQ